MKYDATGFDPNAAFPLIPSGWHPFRVMDFEERKSAKGGHYQVVAQCKCLDPEVDQAIRDSVLIWHFVTFIPVPQPGAGMALHFLSCLGEPHEGEFEIEPANWVGKTFMGKVTVNEYEAADGSKKRNNKFEATSPIKEDAPAARPDPDDPFAEPVPSILGKKKAMRGGGKSEADIDF